MAYHIETIGNQTILYRTTSPPPRPPRDHQADSRRWQQRQIAAGRCRECGRKRRRYKYRCDRHQAHARRLWREHHHHNFGWFETPERQAHYRQQARIAQYVRRLERQQGRETTI